MTLKYGNGFSPLQINGWRDAIQDHLHSGFRNLLAHLKTRQIDIEDPMIQDSISQVVQSENLVMDHRIYASIWANQQLQNAFKTEKFLDIPASLG